MKAPQPSPKKGSRSLTRKAVGGFAWTFTGAGFQAILKIVVLAFMARLLTPDEFGVVSAAMNVVLLADLFSQIGVAPAIVQIRTLDEDKIRTASTITLIFGFLSGAVLFLAAPLMADLFRIAAVEPVIRTFSLIFLVNGVAAIPEALLQREMRFRAISLVQMGGYLGGNVIVGLSMAYAGYGIWALVWGQVAQTVLTGIAFVILRRPQLRPMLHLSSLKHLFNFGGGVTLSRIGNYVAINADYFIVGRWLGADALGFYSRAYVVFVQPVQLVGTAGEKVLFPALSSVQGDIPTLLRGYYRAVSLIAMVTFPLTSVLFVLAPEIVHILLGPNWTSVALPLQILVLSLVFRTAYKVVMTLLRSSGAVYLMAMWQWAYGILVCLGAFLGLPWGIVGVSAGVTIAIITSYWIGVFATTLSSPTSFFAHAAIHARYAVVAAVIAIPLHVLRLELLAFGLHDLLIILSCASLAGVIFLTMFLCFKRLFGEEGLWIRSMVAPFLLKLRRRS